MAIESVASTTQMVSQRSGSRARTASAVAISAVTPITTWPQPGKAVREPARSIVWRMKRRFSIAWSWRSGGGE